MKFKDLDGNILRLGTERKHNIPIEKYESRYQPCGRGRDAGCPAPPTQSVRAALPHTALTSGNGPPCHPLALDRNSPSPVIFDSP